AHDRPRDERSRGLSLYGLGSCALGQQAYTEAVDLLERACRRLASSGTNVLLARARYQLSQAYILGSEGVPAAREILEQNFELTASGDVWNRGMTHSQLGSLAWRDGALAEAEAHLLLAIELQMAFGHRFGLAASLETLAWVAVSNGEHDRA